ncbi:hypothetical protein DFQ28_007941 [Apophysomyces sp. BC1034]|nr:hypothetical protein DFQ28_007941 [Apophysomyces sp. BC1034]
MTTLDEVSGEFHRSLQHLQIGGVTWDEGGAEFRSNPTLDQEFADLVYTWSFDDQADPRPADVVATAPERARGGQFCRNRRVGGHRGGDHGQGEAGVRYPFPGLGWLAGMPIRCDPPGVRREVMNAPVYQEIKGFILARIHAGEWAEGDQVPSENELAREFKVARMTVNRALRELTAEQVLTRVQGAGTFVARPKYESTLVAIRSISDEVAARGHRYRATVLQIGSAAATVAVADEMQLAVGSPVFHSRVLHFEDDEPVRLEERWVDPAIAPEYVLQDFTYTTSNQYLVRVAPLQRAEYRIEAATLDAGGRALLAMDETEPCLVLHRRMWSRGVVASIADLWHPGSRYRFVGHF